LISAVAVCRRRRCRAPAISGLSLWDRGEQRGCGCLLFVKDGGSYAASAESARSSAADAGASLTGSSGASSSAASTASAIATAFSRCCRNFLLCWKSSERKSSAPSFTTATQPWDSQLVSSSECLSWTLTPSEVSASTMYLTREELWFHRPQFMYGPYSRVTVGAPLASAARVSAFKASAAALVQAIFFFRGLQEVCVHQNQGESCERRNQGGSRVAGRRCAPKPRREL